MATLKTGSTAGGSVILTEGEIATAEETTAGAISDKLVTPAAFLAGLRGNIRGTVSQTDGNPTGAIIERDSNEYGWYVKYADGTMIAKGGFSGVTTLSLYSDTINYTSVTITFPHAFVGTTEVFPCASQDATSMGWMKGGTMSEGSTATLHYFTKTSGTVNVSLTAIAIGRWY